MSYIIEGDEAELMVLISKGPIEEMWGAGGHRNAILTVQEAREKLEEARKKGLYAELYVVWRSNADGYIQVESRDLEDIEEDLNEDSDEEEE